MCYLLYINDIPNSVKNSLTKLFADDSNLFIISNSLLNLFDTTNIELSNLSQWIYSNKLYINYAKTNYMLFCPKLKPVSSYDLASAPKLLFNGRNIERVRVVKYLGVFIDENLNWSDHINYVISRVSSLTGILSRNKAILPMKCKNDIYFALVHSTLIYCIEAYGNVCKSVINPLVVKCNRLLRLLQLKARRTPTRELYLAFNTLPFHLLYDFYSAKFIHKCLYRSSQVPVSVRSWFSRGSSLHAHNTRHSDCFILKANCNPKSIIFTGPSLWAKLPTHLQSDPSPTSFHKHYKDFLSSKL